MAISKMKIWRIYSTMRAFNMVSKILMLMNMFRTEHPAAAFRARGTPGMYTFLTLRLALTIGIAILRPTEIMGIEANRRWGVCSLNDFRRVSCYLFIYWSYF